VVTGRAPWFAAPPGAISDVLVIALLGAVVFLCACVVGFGLAALAHVFVHVISTGWQFGGWLA
jgi:hypothetical protein